MQPKQRVEAYLQCMDGRGIPRKSFAPPIWTARWSLGIVLPQPPFLMLPAMITVSALSGTLLVLVLWLVFGLMALLHPFRYPPTLAMLWWTAPITAACMAIANPIY